VRIRVAQVATIVLFALVMGVFWGTWFALSRTMDQLPAATFVTVGHEMIQNLATPMSILLPVALLSSLITLALLRSGRRSPAFGWQLVGLLLMGGVLAVTLLVNVPIDDQIKTWTAATLPPDWRSIQARWENYHTSRTFLSIGAVVAVTISGVVGTRAPARSRARYARVAA
jgi:uncharacterized membrane protein